MKTFKQRIVSVGLSLGLCATALAGGYPKNLNVTNYISSSVAAIVGYPTNSINGTNNGIGQATGNAVFIGDTKEFGITVQGFLRNTGAAAFLDTYWVSAMSSGSPQVVAGTNLTTFGNTVMLSNDFTEGTNNSVRIIIPIPPTLTNWFNWQTNIVATHPLAQANYVGLFTISNNLAASCFLTNFVVKVNTKIIPTALTGN